MAKKYQLKWCLIFIVVLIVSSSLIRSATILQQHFIEFVQFCISLSLSVFVCWMVLSFFLQKQFFRQKPLLNHLVSNLVTWTLMMSIGLTFSYYFPNNHIINDGQLEGGVRSFVVRAAGSFFLSIICYIVLNNLRANESLQKSALEIEQLKQAHLRAQLLSLQQQVSPHFLFNSLSTLKTMSQDQEAKDYIVQLSKVYRHLLNFNEQHLTSLRDELAFLNSYLYILHMRFEDSLVVTINIDEAYLDHFIPPLSLQLLVENAIKHNIATPERPLNITLLTNDEPAIIIQNNFAPKSSEGDSTGMGLQNINDRYLLLIHKPISVLAGEQYFTVSLPLLSSL